MISCKSPKELQKIRTAGRILGAVLDELRQQVRPGVSTRELDALAEYLIRQGGGKPAFKGYKGFPAALCASINEEIVHGIPSERRLLEGDILSLDLGVNYQGFNADAALTVAVGKVSDQLQRLLAVTEEALCRGIEQARVGNRVSDISSAVQSWVESNGFTVVRDLVGHGIGASLHEDPQVPNYGAPGRGHRLVEGIVLAIEPMVNTGTAEVRWRDDNWTAVTGDGGYSAHFEHTVAITADGPEIMTALHEPQVSKIKAALLDQRLAT